MKPEKKRAGNSAKGLPLPEVWAVYIERLHSDVDRCLLRLSILGRHLILISVKSMPGAVEKSQAYFVACYILQLQKYLFSIDKII